MPTLDFWGCGIPLATLDAAGLYEPLRRAKRTRATNRNVVYIAPATLHQLRHITIMRE